MKRCIVLATFAMLVIIVLRTMAPLGLPSTSDVFLRLFGSVEANIDWCARVDISMTAVARGARINLL